MATLAPCRLQIRAMARPMPRPAPVTRTLWFKRRGVVDMASAYCWARRYSAKSCRKKDGNGIIVVNSISVSLLYQTREKMHGR